MKTRHAGFTLIELMITIAIIAILTMIAAPSLRDLVRNSRMTSIANDLMTDLAIARSEAVKRGVRVSVCTSTSGTACTNSAWKDGWIIFTDGGPPDYSGNFGVVDNSPLLKVDPSGTPLLDVVLKISPAVDGANDPTNLITTQNASSATGQYVSFRPSGVTTAGGGTAGNVVHFYLCDARRLPATEATDRGRHIIVTGTGRASATRCSCANDGLTCAP